MAAALTSHAVTVLLVDDQVIVAEAVRRMLAPEPDIRFHHCSDPAKAIETANALRPTLILQDLVMPEIDGLTLVKFYRANPATKDTPLIVLTTKEEPATKARAFALGANDYVVKLPDKLELLARIRYHSKGYINQLERDEAYQKLLESQKALAAEVAQAARYVASLLPAPSRGPVGVDWKFVPSTQLGGDSFGYHWLGPDHFALYLLDVSGHGVGASLLSVSAMNVLSSQALPGTDFRDPAGVLRALNKTFEMERHDNKFFTIWYGVFDKTRRQLLYAGGGHPPALLFTGPDAATAQLSKLDSQGPMIGAWPDCPFEAAAVELADFAQLYLFSDGVFEVSRPDESMWQFSEFVEYLASQPREQPGLPDRLLAHVRQLHGADTLPDDFSMLEVLF